MAQRTRIVAEATRGFARSVKKRSLQLRTRAQPYFTRDSKKLVALGFNQDLIAEGRARNYYNEPLNDEERRFAEIHHNIAYSYLVTNRLSYTDWYDVVILGYLKAVKKWFAKPEIHKYTFCTIAYRTMDTSVWNERQKQKRSPEYRAASLDDVIPETDGVTYGDILCDPRDCVGI